MHHERAGRKRSADCAMLAEIIALSDGKPEHIIALFDYFAKNALGAKGMNGRMQADIEVDRRLDD